MSVVLCTNKPSSPTLTRVLQSLSTQVPPECTWFLILVVNGPDAHRPINVPAGIEASIVRLSSASLLSARIYGFNYKRADAFVLVDDDTILAPDYLHAAEQFLVSRPSVGAAAGRILPELPRVYPDWILPCLPNLAVRDLGGDEVVTGERKFGDWLPIGAGMIVRKEVADHFCLSCRKEGFTDRFGRKNGSLQGGEDTLIAFAAFDLGFACAYAPQLRLVHVINKCRLSSLYLARLNFSLGRSHARVCVAVGYILQPVSFFQLIVQLAERLVHLTTRFPFSGFILWLWYLGFSLESRTMWSFDNVRPKTK